MRSCCHNCSSTMTSRRFEAELSCRGGSRFGRRSVQHRADPGHLECGGDQTDGTFEFGATAIDCSWAPVRSAICLSPQYDYKPWLYIYIYIYMYIYIYIICTYIYINIYIMIVQIHIYIYIYIYTCPHVSWPVVCRLS